MKIVATYILITLILLSVDVFALDHKILEPASSYKEDALLIIVPTKEATPKDYEDLAKHLQQDSHFSLWVGIVNFTDNTPSAYKLVPAIKSIISNINSNNDTKLENSRVYIAAHGHGGFAAYRHAANGRYGGLILLGSYLPEKPNSRRYALEKFPIPVMTIGGELDGIFSLPWMTREFLKFQILRGRNKDRATKRKPVIVLPNMNHYSFSNGDVVKNDIKSSITMEKAFSNIHKLVNSFLMLNAPWANISDSLIYPKKNILSKHLQTTENLLNGFTVAQSSDEHLCQTAQRFSSGFPKSIWRHVDTTPYSHLRESNFHSKTPLLIHKKPKIKLSIHYFVNHHDNPDDKPSITYSPSSIDCKMVTQNNLETIPDLTPDSFEKSCKAVNQISLDIAKSFLSYNQLRRFQSTGKHVVLKEDIVASSSQSWSKKSLKLEKTSYDTFEASSVTYRTEMDDNFEPGVKYCKLISVRRLLEWMLVGALRND